MPVGKIIKAAKYLMKKGGGKTERYLPASETDWLKPDTIRVTKKKPESPMSDADLIQAIRESPDAYIEFAGESRAARAEALRKLSDPILPSPRRVGIAQVISPSIKYCAVWRKHSCRYSIYE
jgi:hypothetical protein